jgi:hypothetical protein
LSKQVIDKINGLKALAGKLSEMRQYLENVISGKFRYNHAIIQNFQVSISSTPINLNNLFNLGHIQSFAKLVNR